MGLLKYWKWAVMFFLITVAGTLYYLNQNLTTSLEEKERQIVKLEESNKSLQSTMQDLQNNFERQALRLEKLSGDSRVLQEINNQLRNELGGYKDREKVVVAKPELIQRRTNDAVDKLMREYECSTSATGCQASGGEARETSKDKSD